ncbi:MAG: hypothetical protein GX557_09445, partial [Chloroflexi bacterium]|nr:hypothetical protein [Chloroflexota bacterium]
MAEQTHPTYDERIQALYRAKTDFNELKIRSYGHWDSDDHGYIPWLQPIPFTSEPTDEDGVAYGVRGVGRNFRKWLEVHPIYINPNSATAGAWVQNGIPGVCGYQRLLPRGENRPRGKNNPDVPQPFNWAPKDRPADQSIFALQRKYNHYAGGIGSANHLSPDMRIGLDLGWGGLLAKLRRFRAYNHPDDPSFYDGEEDLVLGVQAWIRRHVEAARDMAAH